jgi:malonyl CoA-acyl carrier protein transacylase
VTSRQAGLPSADLAFCFPCQPLAPFEWDPAVAAGHPEAEEMLRRAAEALTDPSLSAPTRLQVITFASAAACASVLLAENRRPASCLPHSMGLYAALVAAGACEFIPMLRYVVEAGQAIHEFGRAGDYEMASIFGIPNREVETLCREREGVYIANYNATGHAVVSGLRPAVEAVCRAALERDCYEVRPLGTGVPLHTPLMRPVSRRLAGTLGGLTVAPPRATVFCPYRVAPLAPAEIPDTLAEHISQPVRFEAMVQAVVGAGVRLILEVGYEKLLSKFVGWTAPDLAARSVGSARALQREIRLAGR